MYRCMFDRCYGHTLHEVPMNSERKAFLTVYNYGMGGVWRYILADSRAEIECEFPQLQFPDKIPENRNEAARSSVLTVDISDASDPYLNSLKAEPDKRRI